MTMRIGFDATPLIGQRSGIGHYTDRLIRMLSVENPDWEFLLYSNRPVEQAAYEHPNVVSVPGSLQRSRWLWMQWQLPGQIRSSRPDLCHFPNNSAPWGAPAPYVITIHDASLLLYREYHPASRILALRLLLPAAARRARAVITDSQHARAELIRALGLAPDKVHVIYPAAPPGFGPINDPALLDSVRQKYGLPDKFVLFVGAIEPRKNLSRLIEAMRQLPAAPPLVLAGPVPTRMKRSSGAAILASDTGRRVRYLGYVPQADLAGLYSLAEVLSFPSLHEGFGLPALEAMACGLPVLTSKGSAMAEVCGGTAMLVDPYDVESIAAGLAELLARPGLRAERRAQGLLRARQFSWEKAARQTAALYKQVLAEGSQ